MNTTSLNTLGELIQPSSQHLFTSPITSGYYLMATWSLYGKT